ASGPRFDRTGHRARAPRGHPGEVPVVLPGVRVAGPRGRAAGPRPGRRHAAGVRSFPCRHRGAHLSAVRSTAPGEGLIMSQIIDVHTHYVPKGWPDVTADGGADEPWLRIETEREAMMMTGSSEFRRIQSDCWDPQIRLADMDADGVDVQVVSPTPVFFNYARSGKQAANIAKVFNDLALEIVAPAGERMIPFCQVPLQDPDLACAELDRCLDSGHRGVEIGNHVGDRDLDDEGVITFLQHC